MKLKRFYDHANRLFNCSLAIGCQRSNPFTTNGACVVADCNDCYENTPLLKPLFSPMWYPYHSNRAVDLSHIRTWVRICH